MIKKSKMSTEAVIGDMATSIGERKYINKKKTNQQKEFYLNTRIKFSPFFFYTTLNL